MRNIILLVCCLFLLPACGPKQISQEDIEKHYSILKGSWEENQAIMRAAEKTRNYAVVIKTGQEELAERPSNDDARLVMARIYTKLGYPDQSFEILDVIINQENPQVFIEQARAFLAQKDMANAHLQLDKVIAGVDFALQRSVDKLRAIAFDMDGKHEEAQELYKNVLLVQSEATVQFNLAHSLMITENYKEALANLLPILDNENTPQARLAAAACMVKLKNKKGAANLLEGFMSDSDIAKALGD